MTMSPEAAVCEAERQLGETAGYSVLHHKRWTMTLKYLLTFCPPSTHPKVLDIGVWPGYQSLALVKTGYTVTGMDIDPGRLPSLPLFTTTFNLNMEDHFPVAIHSFDIVVATEIIEHLQVHRIPVFLAAARMALRPGGLLLITTPNRHHLGARLKSRAHGTDEAGHGHTHEYARAELGELFGGGWKIEFSAYVDMYRGVGKISDQQYFRPITSFLSHPQRAHNGLKMLSGSFQMFYPAVRDTLVLMARTR